MSDDNSWRRWGRYTVAGLLAAVAGWYAFVAHREVPVLDLVDLGVHETGHLLTAFAPRMVMFLAGSLAQVMVPLALAWYFGVHRRDAAGGGFCLAWAGTSAWDVGVYIADAPAQALPLIGGGQHDWAYLLGSSGWGILHLAHRIAAVVSIVGGAMVVVGIGVTGWRALSGLVPRRAASPDPISDRGTHDDLWLEAAKLPFKHEAA